MLRRITALAALAVTSALYEDVALRIAEAKSRARPASSTSLC